MTLDQKITLRGCLARYGQYTPPNIDVGTLKLWFRERFGKGLSYVYELDWKNLPPHSMQEKNRAKLRNVAPFKIP